MPNFQTTIYSYDNASGELWPLFKPALIWRDSGALHLAVLSVTALKQLLLN